MHEAFFFGPPDDQVFAIYHPPSGMGSDELVVICPPLFSEYMRTHLALRELAITLAEQGRHVIRIDYRGTGDSSRELDDVSITDWVDDIRHAVDEGRELAGSRSTILVAVRAAALVACRAATTIRDLRTVVLWDPVTSGADYLASLQRVQHDIIERNPGLSHAELAVVSQHHAGYRLSSRMLHEIAMLGSDDVRALPAGKLHVITTADGDAFDIAGLTVHTERFQCTWETDAEDLMMPQPVLERVVRCVAGS